MSCHCKQYNSGCDGCNIIFDVIGLFQFFLCALSLQSTLIKFNRLNVLKAIGSGYSINFNLTYYFTFCITFNVKQYELYLLSIQELFYNGLIIICKCDVV